MKHKNTFSNKMLGGFAWLAQQLFSTPFGLVMPEPKFKFQPALSSANRNPIPRMGTQAVMRGLGQEISISQMFRERKNK